MAVSFVAASYTGGGLTATEPTGTTSGDVMVALVMAGSHTAHTGPAGWTALDQVDGSNAQRASTWVIARGGSAPALTWAGPLAADTSIEILTYRGANTTTPVDGHSLAEVLGDSTPDSASLTTTVASDVLLATLVHAFEDPVTITIPAGMTSRFNKPSGDWFAGADLALGAAGATGAKTWTEAGTNHNSLMASIAIAPAATGTTLSGGPTLARIVIGGVLVETFLLSGGAVLRGLSVTGALAESSVLSGAVVLRGLAVAGTLVETFTLTGAVTLAGPSVTGSLSTAVGTTLSGGPLLAGLTVSGALSLMYVLSGGVVLPGLRVAGNLTVPLGAPAVGTAVVLIAPTRGTTAPSAVAYERLVVVAQPSPAPGQGTSGPRDPGHQRPTISGPAPVLAGSARST